MTGRQASGLPKDRPVAIWKVAAIQARTLSVGQTRKVLRCRGVKFLAKAIMVGGSVDFKRLAPHYACARPIRPDEAPIGSPDAANWPLEMPGGRPMHHDNDVLVSQRVA